MNDLFRSANPINLLSKINSVLKCKSFSLFSSGALRWRDTPSAFFKHPLPFIITFMLAENEELLTSYSQLGNLFTDSLKEC